MGAAGFESATHFRWTRTRVLSRLLGMPATIRRAGRFPWRVLQPPRVGSLWEDDAVMPSDALSSK
jgi:hypothetical protein